MTGKKFSILIVGAGIAGLATSIALVEKGYSVTVLEAAPQVRTSHLLSLLIKLIICSLQRLVPASRSRRTP